MGPAERAGVLCAGTLVVDVGKVIDAYPPLDGLATIEDISMSTGGAALNLAVDLRRLDPDFEVAILGTVGDDDHGDYLLAACDEAGIDRSGMTIAAGASTAFTDVMVERDGGRRTFFTSLGTNALSQVTPDLLATSRARILHVGAPGVHPLMDAALPDGGNGWSILLAAARDRLADAMTIAPDESGMHLIGFLKGERRDGALSRAAAAEGIDLSPLSRFYLNAPPRHGVLLGYAGVSEPKIRSGIDVLARLLDVA